MKMGIRVSIGDRERTISSDELGRFADLLQLPRIAPDRCSQLLVAELLLWNEIHGHEPFQVARQIEALENGGAESSTKEATEFKHPPLKGLWHKHFFDAHFVAKNLLNHWSGNKMKRMLEEVCEPEKGGLFTEEMANEVIHRTVQGALDQRTQDNQLTGEWIVFAKHEGENYYLCLARHTDGDDAIYSKLQALVFPEFPFLENQEG